VFSANWRLVKLYFMIGLPTEGEEDLQGSSLLCQKALRVARRAKSSPQINVSISTFVPKAHTPFRGRAKIPWRKSVKNKNFSGEDWSARDYISNGRCSDEPSRGVLARGDRRLGRVLEIAHSLGCRLDGWENIFAMLFGKRL